MFDWFWSFLYSISKSLFRIIDAMTLGCKKLCGIDTIEIKGEPTTFLGYLLNSEKVRSAFWLVCMIALIVLTIFTIIAILRTIVKEKSEGTPGQITVKALKALLLFICVPIIMTFGMLLMDQIALAVYTATGGTANSTIGTFLFVTFAEDCPQFTPEIAQDFLNGTYSYFDTDAVWSAVGNLKNFDFLLSWICGIAIMFPIASMLIMFVDRAISIVLLFIASPFSISSSVLDDGQRAKLWRDQVLVKFIQGYGSIIALNIYMILVGLVMSGDVVFFSDKTPQLIPIFSNRFLNNLLKIAIILGGAFSLKKLMAVAGNLVAAGAGSNELRDAEAATAGVKSFAGGMLGAAVGAAKTPGALYNFGRDSAKFGLFSTIGNRLGLKTAKDYKFYDNMNNAGRGGGGGGGGGTPNNDSPKFSSPEKKNNLNNTLQNNQNKGSNQNSNKPQGSGNNLVVNAMNMGNNLNGNDNEIK